MVVHVERCYQDKDLILGEFVYMFDKDIDELCKRSSQY